MFLDVLPYLITALGASLSSLAGSYLVFKNRVIEATVSERKLYIEGLRGIAEDRDKQISGLRSEIAELKEELRLFKKQEIEWFDKYATVFDSNSDLATTNKILASKLRDCEESKDGLRRATYLLETENESRTEREKK